MRRVIVPALLAASISFLGAHGSPAAEFTPSGEKVQEVRGSIAAPTRFTNGTQGFPGLGRRAYLLNPATNGSVMYVFDVDPGTWGGAFVIDGVTDATGSADLDIYLYENFGTAEFPGATDVVSLAEYDTPAPGEVGFIPPGTRKAIVFTANGVNSTFTYTGYSPPVVQLGAAASLDLTVPAGAFVVWENQTGNYAFVRHLPEDGQEALFDSSPEPATGIANGARFSTRFADPGTYRYETSVGIGTVTVTEGPGSGAPAA